MNASTDILRRAAAAAFVIAVLVALASCLGLAISFVKPTLELHKLYRVSSLARTAGFWFLGSYVVAGFAFLGAPSSPTNVKTRSWESRALNILCGVCFLLIVLSPHTYVYPEAAGWVTKSKAGTFSISSDVAKEYLWRAVRMWSAIPLCLSLMIISFTREVMRRPRQ
jgi:hypothetical protein